MKSNSNMESQAVREILEDKLSQMRPTETLPAEVKDQVFSTLNSLQLIADITDLFTAKFIQTDLEYLDGLTSSNEEKGEGKEDIEGQSR